MTRLRKQGLTTNKGFVRIFALASFFQISQVLAAGRSAISCGPATSGLAQAHSIPPSRELWLADGDYAVENIPLAHFQSAGVAHIPLSEALQSQLAAYDSDLFRGLRRESLPHPWISEIQAMQQAEQNIEMASEQILRETREAFAQAQPHYELKCPQKIRVRSTSITEGWHNDIYGERGAPERLLIPFVQGILREFTVRFTFPFPMDLAPPTLVKPLSGPLAEKGVQGLPGSLTAFVMELVDHSTPPVLVKRHYQRILGSFDCIMTMRP